MNTQAVTGAKIKETLKEVTARLTATRDAVNDTELLQKCFADIIAACGGDLLMAIKVLMRHAALAEAAFSEMEEQVSNRPVLARVLTRPFPVGSNGKAHLMVYVTPVGTDFLNVILALVPQQTQPERVPPPLGLCYVGAGGTIFLNAAAEPPPLAAEQCTVVEANLSPRGADEAAVWSEVSELVVSDVGQQRRIVYAKRPLAQSIADLLSKGHEVTVRVEGRVVSGIASRASGETTEDYLEFPDVNSGPPLEALIFPAWLHQEWQRDVTRMAAGRHAAVLLIGPTGTGKTEAVLRASKAAARAAGKPLAFFRLSAPHISSSYYGETERNLFRVGKRMRTLHDERHLVVALIDEADAIMGASEGRYEGSVDRRVRLAFQELIGSMVTTANVYLTMNLRSDSWLPAPIERRFLKRTYPRTSRSQIAAICALYAKPEAMERLGMQASEFGTRVADYVFNDAFVVAIAHFHSCQTVSVRARDLHSCSPGKLNDLVTQFCDDVTDGLASSLDMLWTRVERDFRSSTLNAANLFEMTFLRAPTHDSVKALELVGIQAGPRSVGAAAQVRGMP
ncbi:MAG: AAA family ATPase [Candidatus Eisenbacteria bacterium]|nr:AAA family ATPase [Candidatus Eisenbacteria bacterium]